MKKQNLKKENKRREKKKNRESLDNLEKKGKIKTKFKENYDDFEDWISTNRLDNS